MFNHPISPSARYLRQVLDSIFAFVAILTPDGLIVEVNRASLEAAGLAREQVLGIPLPDSYWFSSLPEQRDQVRQAIEAARKGRSVREDLIVRAGAGRFITLDGVVGPLRNDDGSIELLIASGLDITERNRAEESLRQSEERFRQIAEAISDVFWLANTQGEVVYASPAYETIWGRSCQSVYAAPHAWLEWVHPEDRERMRALALTTQLQRNCDEEFRIVRPDGAIRWIRDISSPVRDARGEVVRVARIMEDVTDRRSLEAQLRQSQKMEAIGLLAGGVAHDFNNLLTVISGYSDLVLESLADDDPNRESLQEIHKAGERAAALTRQLLLFSRKHVVSPKLVAINHVIRDAHQMMRRLVGPGVALEMALDAREDTVRIDLGQLGQVLLNLTVNAREAMPNGGTLTITTANREVASDGPGRAAIAPGRYVVLSIADTGTGMNPDVQRHLFEPFFTTKAPGAGTGLGLAVVHGVIGQSGGHIEVSSAEHSGTAFHIYLPLAELQAIPADLASTPAGSETILLVEDESALRQIVRRVLQGNGYRVLEASDGDEALRMYVEKGEAIHLVITDVVMPAMGGRALVEHLHALDPGLKVLFVSGYNDDAVMREGIQQHLVHFLEKPFTARALATKVREILDQ